MGKRSRTRAATKPKPPRIPDHMARVRVSDEVWADFRTACGSPGVARRLAELVEADVRAFRRRRLTSGALTDRELVATVVEARKLHADLTAVIPRLERRLDGPHQEPCAVYEETLLQR